MMMIEGPSDLSIQYWLGWCFHKIVLHREKARPCFTKFEIEIDRVDGI
jgi:hypothetical protein